mgnify:CR=1 FL=1
MFVLTIGMVEGAEASDPTNYLSCIFYQLTTTAMSAPSDYEWSVGDQYYIGSSYSPTWGEIQEINDDGYHVAWEDGTTTVEEKPDPADSFWD